MRRSWQRAAGATAHWSPTARGLLWAAGSGVLFGVLNATVRGLSQQLHPMQSQFLRYLLGSVAMLVLVVPALMHTARHRLEARQPAPPNPLAAWWPKNLGGQFTRGAVHTVGLVLWFTALPRIPLADMTAISFTTPVFVMLGAAYVLGEPLHRERWLAVAAGLGGVLVLLAPKLSGTGGVYHLVMLLSAPVFAASFLITKTLTRSETAGVIVLWQSLTVTAFSLPLALWVWQAPTAAQWLGFAVCGVLGTGGHYCLTRSFQSADISSTQSMRFLDLLWAAALGWWMFGDAPAASTLAGGVLICTATLWVARREHLRHQQQREQQQQLLQTPPP
jgi:drug/metabolite transporter (DMT)-like permease